MAAAHDTLHLLFLLLGATTPLAAGMALWRPGGASLLALKVHAGGFLAAALLVCAALRLRPMPDEPGTGAMLPITAGLAALLALDLIALAFAARRAERSTGRFVFSGIVAGGALAAALAPALFPRTVAARIATAADAAAGGAPYCLYAGGRAARARADLVAALAGPPTNGFHAILRIDAPDGPRHLNWSHRAERFDPVPPATARDLRLDNLPPCAATPHLARGWG
jgi:hypothetical protein